MALGSNLGEPLLQLRAARRELEGLGRIEAVSSLYRTTPVGGPGGQPDYLNAVVELTPAPELLRPASLLRALHEVEFRHGRSRQRQWEARRLDLDLLALGELVLDRPDLVLPHPRMLERAFVLAPLCEIAPTWRHPLAQCTACEALAPLSMEGVASTRLSWGAG